MDGARPRRIGLREFGLSTAGIMGAATAGVAQPLLDLYGKNATLFSAAKLHGRSVVEFALLVALLVPVGWVVVAVPLVFVPRVFRIWRAIGIGIGFGLAALVFLNSHDVLARYELPAAALIAIASAVLYERHRALRSVAALLGLLAPVTVGLFLGVSSVAHIAWSASGRNVAIPAGQIKHKPTVVWVVMDETNLAMLLDQQQRIDASRYPHLAALAATSTWYRNAVGIDSFTPRAVPGLLASRDGAGSAWPTPADYPVNLFSLLADAYRLDAFEPVTDLCAAPSCLPNAFHGTRSLRAFMRDASIVYATMALPSSLSSHLPSITNSWGGFASTGAAPQQGSVHLDANHTNPLAKLFAAPHGPQRELATAADFTSRIRTGEAPTVHFLHILLPHRPWRLTPDSSDYGEDHGTQALSRAPKDLWLAQDEAARFALQAGAADAMIGRLVDRLRATGRWQDTFLVVTADHGINFEPGMTARQPASDGTLDELYRVPLIVHAPGQATGAVSDAPASTEDILPTLLGVLGAPPIKGAAGLDLAQPVPVGRKRLVWSAGKSYPFPPGTATIGSRVATYARWFPPAAAGWDRIFARGPYRGLFGRAVAAGAGTAAGYRVRVQFPNPRKPVADQSVGVVRVVVGAPAGARVGDGTVVVASGGRVVGFLGGAGGSTGSGITIEGVVDWRHAGAPGGLQFYLASGPASAPLLQRISG